MVPNKPEQDNELLGVGNSQNETQSSESPAASPDDAQYMGAVEADGVEDVIENPNQPQTQSPEGISSPGLEEGAVGEGASWEPSQTEEPNNAKPPELDDKPTAVPNDGEGNVPPEPVTDAPSMFAKPENAASPAPGSADADAADAGAPSEAHDGSHAQEFKQAVASGAADAPGLKRGDMIDGTIIETSPTQVRVDVGGKTEGIIPTSELEKMGRSVMETLVVGETMKFYVVNPSSVQGNVVLSLNRAQEELDWQRAETMQKSQEIIESQIAGYNKGGLIVRFGRLRGFVPQSQMSAERRRQLEPADEKSWSAQVNQEISVKVMEVDRSRNRLILSERSTSRETREQRKANLISQLTVGELREGRVVSLEDFGAFVDIGGAEGLVHLTEISWQHVTHPRDVLKPGQVVTVRVISIDPNAKRIGLSMKQLEGDPWDRVLTGFTEGQLVKAQITKLTKFGAFAQIVDLPEIEGLIHISELSDQRVNHPREVVNEGDLLTLRVVRIEAKDRRLALSLKKVNSAEYLDLDWGNEASAAAE